MFANVMSHSKIQKEVPCDNCKGTFKNELRSPGITVAVTLRRNHGGGLGDVEKPAPWRVQWTHRCVSVPVSHVVCCGEKENVTLVRRGGYCTPSSIILKTFDVSGRAESRGEARPINGESDASLKLLGSYICYIYMCMSHFFECMGIPAYCPWFVA